MIYLAVDLANQFFFCLANYRNMRGELLTNVVSSSFLRIL